MNSKDIKTWQAEKIHDRIGPTMLYLGRLRARLDKLGFEKSDPFYQVVVKTYDAVHHLSVQTHYLSCSSLGGRSSEE